MKSEATHRRILIYFLVDIRAIEPITAATYLKRAGLKSHEIEELLEQILNLRENNQKLDVLI